ncbi:MAG: hypothetical protein JSV94_00530 [Methanobacteriota archaeon]|nr:MAG: hypothetical protein JSV94_00530 [Euryarchaeota archaeon]
MMASRTRALGVSVAAVNVVIFILAFTSIYPFPAGDFKIDLPTASEVVWTYDSGEVTVTAPFTIDNGGYYSVADLLIEYRVSNYTGLAIAEDMLEIGTMKAGTVTSGEIVFAFDLADMYARGLTWMIFNDDLLEFVVEVSCYYTMKLVKFDAVYSVSIPWDALIQSVRVGDPWIDPMDPQTIVVDYNLVTSDILQGSTTVHAELFDDGVIVSESDETVSLGRSVTGTLEFSVPLGSVPDSVVVEFTIPGIPVVASYEFPLEVVP